MKLLAGPPLLALLALAFACGIGAGASLPALHAMPAIGAVLGVAAAAALLRTPRRECAALAFLLLGAIAGALAAGNRAADCRTRIPDGHTVTLRGRFALPFDADGRSTLLASAIRVRGMWHSCSGPLRAFRSPDASDRVSAGASVVVKGVWRSLPRARLDAPARAGILEVDRVLPDAARGSRWTALRAGARKRMTTLFGDYEPLASSLVITATATLDPVMRERFAESGIAHLLSISGLHVGLVTGIVLLLGALLRVSRRRAAYSAALLTIVYVVFAGAPYPAIRSLLQILLLTAAVLIQRPARATALVAAAALPIMAFDPLAVLDIGFQLSFAGILGLVALRRPVERWLPVRNRVLRVSIASSIAATLATAPATAFHFGQIAPAGVVANLIAVPITGLLVPTLGAALALSWVSWGAAHFVAGAGILLLEALDWTARVFAAIPFAHVTVARGDLVQVALLGACALGMVIVFRNTTGRSRTLGCGAVAALWLLLPSARPRTLDIYALDVGQGDAIAIRTPAGRWMLVDAGPRFGDRDAGRRVVVPFLRAHGVRRLEALIITHPDADHIGGAPAVLAAMPAARVIEPAAAFGRTLHESSLQAAMDRRAEWMAARAGTELVVDGVRLTFLFPDSATLDASPEANEVSVVFRLVFGQFEALFLGDAPENVEQRLVKIHGDGLGADVLKVGHHGSSTSTAPELLAAVRARDALIPVGRGNRYGHPAPDVIARLRSAGVRAWRTDRQGTLRVRAGRDGAYDVAALP